MSGLKPKNLGHYWRLKREWEIMSREAKKMANKLDNAEYAWSRAKLLQSDKQQCQDKANEVRDLGLDLARLQGKVAKLQAVLEAFENSIPKKVPIEIEGGMGDEG